MKALRDSCVQLLETIQRENRAPSGHYKQRVALAAWNSHVVWCNDGNWIEEPSEADFKWCRHLCHGGGNNMRFAIEEVMRRFPTVGEVFVMCDGDLSPFGLDNEERSDDGLDVPKPDSPNNESCNERMQRMAILGHGSYTEINCS